MEHVLSFIELARVNKPAGALLILWPFIWGSIMAARRTGTSPLILLKQLGIGCVWFFLLRGAGCIWNDIVDRDIDGQVERTKKRPIPTGRISVQEASCFLSVHIIFLSLSIGLWGNKQLAVLGLVTIFPLAGGYPFMKRISWWPQAWLGVTFNMGAMMSWSWTTGHIPLSSVTLTLACWFWTMWYDTIYGSQDKKDDVKIGIGSTALLFKSNQITKLFLIFHGLMFSLWLTVSGILNDVRPMSSPFYLIGVVGSTFHLGVQLWVLNLESPVSCSSAFSNNALVVGPTVTLGLLADYLCALNNN